MTLLHAVLLPAKPILFTLLLLPMAINTLLNNVLWNRVNVAIFVCGVGLSMLDPISGDWKFQLPRLWVWVTWVIVVSLLVFGWYARWIGGGFAKLLMALLPWFSVPQFLAVGAGGFVIAAIVAKLRGQVDVQPTPYVLSIGLIVLIGDIAIR